MLWPSVLHAQQWPSAVHAQWRPEVHNSGNSRLGAGAAAGGGGLLIAS